MHHSSYTIVTINTVPVTEYYHRLLEICIVHIKNNIEVGRFNSLINPQRPLGKDVLEHTGLTNDILRFEPVFCEVADEILYYLKNTVVVTFSDFAYKVLRSEFKKIGYQLSVPTSCVSILLNKNFPNLPNSLKLISEHFEICKGDLKRCDVMAEIMVEIIQRLNLAILDSNSSVNPYNKKDRIDISRLERKPGVYYFKNSSGVVIYVGKAVRIKDRVKSHFNSNLQREQIICSETTEINHVYTGSNLIAELSESDEIMQYHPKYNIAQKKHTSPFIVVSKINKKGYMQMSIVRKDYPDSINEVFYNRKSVAKKLIELCKEYELCPKFSGFHKALGKCKHDNFLDCPSACIGEEPPETYNLRVKAALKSLECNQNSFAIKLRGRTKDEMGFVLVRDGVYLGFGYVELNEQIVSLHDFESFIVHKTHSYHTTRIIDSFIQKPLNKSKIIYLDRVEF